jgi:intracellular sulfur oxidation DsrE/DsrF family protein
MKKLFATLAAFLFATQLAYAAGVVHKVAIHVDQADPAVQNMALNNAINVTQYYESQGDTVIIELVAYGPGLTMYIPGKSKVGDRISTMSLEMENLSFAACGNTHRKMSEKAGQEIPLMDEAKVVTSGVVRLIELQEAGYAYVRP